MLGLAPEPFDYTLEVVRLEEGDRVSNLSFDRCAIIVADGTELTGCVFSGCELLEQDGSRFLLHMFDDHRNVGPKRLTQAGVDFGGLPREAAQLLGPQIRAMGGRLYRGDLMECA